MDPNVQRHELENLRLLDTVDIDQVLPALRQCPVVTLGPDEVLISSGQINHHLYIILSGRLRVHLQGESNFPVALLDSGESVGEISIIDRQPTSANVVADMDSRLLRISEDTLWTMCESSGGFAYNLLRVLAQRLRSGNTVIHKIHELLREYEYDATIDPLTGLYNRRWLDTMMGRIMQRCAHSNQPLALLMIDIDDFKSFNDTHGHLAGDHALVTVSRTLLSHLRPEDLVTRYGGEELLAILPGSSVADASQVAERLRAAVCQRHVALSTGESLEPVTISLGIGQMDAGDVPDTLIEKADKALYRAKHRGKNRFST